MANFIGPLDWSKKQGYILTGGGSLLELMIPGRDFQEEDLPHFHLRNETTYEAFATWLSEDRRSHLICGLWTRPLFAGGWAESTDADTTAYNMQTPSLFIDMRFPVCRPSHFKNKTSLSDFSFDELRLLARQHCFAGYCLPEKDPESVYTRHHIIDWNYHPSYPRPRPNRWRVELKEDKMSFKEHSVAVDKFGVPVYMERWARVGDDSMGKKHFAARRRRILHHTARKDYRDGVLVIMGDHFTLAIDRLQSLPSFEGCEGCSGGPSLVDYAASVGDRASIEAYLDLQGSYGRIYDDEEGGELEGYGSQERRHTHGGGYGGRATRKIWSIIKCTHPWLEGHSPLSLNGPVQLKFGRSRGGQVGARARHRTPTTMVWAGYEWDIMECSFTVAELRDIFNCNIDDTPSSLGVISRL